MAAPVADMGAASAIADFSDNEHITNHQSASEDEKTTYTKPRGGLAARMAAATSKSLHDDSASENEEPTDYVSKAAGFAARMKALESKKIFESSDEEEEEEDPRMKGLSARERMKIMFQREKEPAQPELPKPISALIISTNVAQSSDDDEEDLKVARKPRNRPARTSSHAKEATPEPVSGGPAEESLFFSSPLKPTQDTIAEASDDDALPDLTKLRATSTFKALLAKKKAERLAKEAAEEEARRLRHEETRQLLAEASSDSEADRIMGSIPNMKKWHDKHGRTKRTSRKAIEEESRETQRMARNMQLAHEITTKKKISKQSLFARFNYKAEGMDEEEPPSSSPRKVGDVASTQEQETPVTSPMTHEAQESREATAKPIGECQNNSAAEDEEMPTFEEALASSAPRRFTAAEKSIGAAPPSQTTVQPPAARIAKQILVLNPKITARASMSADDDSDDDLEIVKRKPIKTKKDIDEIFKNVPAKKQAESAGMHALRLLANLTSPSKNQTNNRKKNARPSINQAELTVTLQQKARQQAARDREEKLNELRAKGVHIPTKEEKEAEQNEVIDLVARAREENARIRKEERKAQRLANLEAGILDSLDDSDDSDDEDWDEDAPRKHTASASESDEEADDEIELSGSEDEEMVNEDVDTVENDVIDDAASESENDKDEEMGEAVAADFINDNPSDSDTAPTLPSAASRRRSRKSQIVDSDDEVDDATPTISVQNTPRPQMAKTPGSVRFLGQSPAVPTSVFRSATKNFIPGIPVNGAVGLGLTQIFAGTMDSQADFDGSPMPSPTQESPQTSFDSQQDSLAFLKNLPPPAFGAPAPRATAEEMNIIPSSQAEIDTIPATQEGSTQAIKLSLDTQSQSQAPDLTQDQGLSFMSPIKGRYSATPASSVDTVVIAGTPHLPEATPSVIADSVVDSISESPVRTKKGKLRRRVKAPATFGDDEDEVKAENDFPVTPNVFETMRLAASQAKAERRARREREEFDKQKSKAREMVDEAATESEDEYAGLGGVSGSDSDSDDEALNKEMLDETKLSRKDKAEIAALAAKMDLEEDEARVNKLYKDITTGGIRRKRGADYDLSDSDDDGEARRRMKRREFAKMRKALMEDENVGKIVKNPKSAAFLKSLEDREDDMDLDDFGFGDEAIVDIDHATNSQLPADGESQDQNGSGENSQSEAMAPPKQTGRLPPTQRRTRAIQEDKRASSLAEIRANVSQLLEDPNAVHLAASSDDDDEDSDHDIEGEDDDKLSVHEGLLSDDDDEIMEPQDTSVILGETSIIKTTSRREKGRGKENLDPFASRRSSVAVVDRSLSRQNSAASSDSSRMAFGPASSISSGFKVPPLLRKATGNSISSAATSFSGEAASAKLAAAVMGKSSGASASSAAKKGYKGFAKEEQRQKVIQEGEMKRIEKKLRGAEERRRTVGGVFGGGRFE